MNRVSGSYIERKRERKRERSDVFPPIKSDLKGLAIYDPKAKGDRFEEETKEPTKNQLWLVYEGVHL